MVSRQRHDDVKTFTIAVPSLQRLTITDHTYYSVYVIKAPSLKYLKIQGFAGVGSCLIEHAPKLMEAYINIRDVISDDILGSLTSVKRLSLKISPLEVNVFNQFSFLSLHDFFY